MNDYRATVNLPGQARGTVAPWPDSPRTAVLIGQGILIPAQRSLVDPIDEPEPPVAQEPPSEPVTPPERPSAARKAKKAAPAPNRASDAADED